MEQKNIKTYSNGVQVRRRCAIQFFCLLGTLQWSTHNTMHNVR